MEITLRDAFFDKLYDIAKKDRDVVLVSADMGAPSLDKFRADLNSQYLNVGVAEENMIAVAVGLALSRKKVFIYAIVPFTTSRCYEFIKLDISLTKTPITIIGVGAGYSYDDSGPTHHATEDISIMRVLPNMEILNPSDSIMAESFAEMAYKSDHPIYIRLDRKILPNYSNKSDSFKEGYKELKLGKGICIVATGNMIQNALIIHDKCLEKGKNIGVINLYRLKPINVKKFKNCLEKYEHIISWEEHLLAGGMGSILAEIIMDNKLCVKLTRFGVDDQYCYMYGRRNIQRRTGIDVDNVMNEIMEY
jgi:transketolase